MSILIIVLITCCNSFENDNTKVNMAERVNEDNNIMEEFKRYSETFNSLHYTMYNTYYLKKDILRSLSKENAQEFEKVYRDIYFSSFYPEIKYYRVFVYKEKVKIHSFEHGENNFSISDKKVLMNFTNKMSPPPINKIVTKAFEGVTQTKEEILIINSEEFIDKYNVSIKIEGIIKPLDKM